MEVSIERERERGGGGGGGGGGYNAMPTGTCIYMYVGVCAHTGRTETVVAATLARGGGGGGGGGGTCGVLALPDFLLLRLSGVEVREQGESWVRASLRFSTSR